MKAMLSADNKCLYKDYREDLQEQRVPSKKCGRRFIQGKSEMTLMQISGQTDGFIEIDGTRLKMTVSFKHLETITSATSFITTELKL